MIHLSSAIDVMDNCSYSCHLWLRRHLFMKMSFYGSSEWSENEMPWLKKSILTSWKVSTYQINQCTVLAST